MRPATSAEGRERELDRLHEVLAQVGESGPRLALLEGPVGVGKRRIVEAFCARSRASGAHVLVGECLQGEPHAPFSAIVEQALALLGPSGVRGVRLAELACPDGCCPLWFRHRGAATRTREETSVARRCLQAAVVDLLEALASVRPTVIVVHGLEEADQETLELLEQLLDAVPSVSRRDAPQLMAVGTLRGTGRAEVLRRHPRVIRLSVDALDAEGLRALLASPEYLGRLLASTGGLPAALERLIDTGPPSPQAHLRRRAARLPPDARALLEALAVWGRAADVEALAFVAEVADGPAAVAVLLESGLVRPDAVDATRLILGDPEDGPRLLSDLSPDRRAALAERCIARCQQEPREPAEALRHALRAGRSDQVAGLWREAADVLEARRADAVAAELLSRAERLLGEAAPDALRARLADLWIATGELRAALRPARAVLANDPAAPEAARRVAQALVLAGDLSEAARVIERARAAAADRGERALELAATLAELRYQSGRLAEAAAAADDVLAGEASDEARLSAMQTRAKVALAQGRLEDAAGAYEGYAEAARQLGDLRHEALAVGGVGVVMLTRGALGEAETALRRCAQLAEAAEDRKGQALAWHNLAVGAHLAHDYATARSRYDEALRLLRMVGNRSSLARAAYNLGELYESLGDRRGARALCDFGAQVGGTGVAPRASAEGLLLRGRIELGEGNVAQARLAFEAARGVLEEVDPLRAAAALVGLARAALHDGHCEVAEAFLDRVPDGVAAARRAEVALVRAALERAVGRDPLHHARAALDAAREAADPRLEVEAQAELAQSLLDRGQHAEAMETCERARSLDAELGRRVPEDLAAAWDDRPTRRRLLSLAQGSRVAARQAPRPSAPAPRSLLVGRSESIQRLHALVERVGPSRCTVLLTGESGTGKERLAEALHLASERRDGPLVRVNCAALVETLLVSELFGHEKGAFTGAHERKLGRFELADGGTLFLDEIGDISPAVQAALLRVLQERRFERVGGRRSIEVDVRIVAATNRNLEAMVRAGTFREDLYYRLDEVRIALPPLREHLDDVPDLADHFLRRIAAERDEEPKRLSPEAAARLASQRWPGNVRQLENCLRAATLFADGPVLGTEHLQGLSTPTAAPAPESGAVDEEDGHYLRVRSGELSLRDLKKEVERRCIEQALGECEGNISKAAGLLGMKRPRLSQLVKEYGLGGASGGRCEEAGER